MYVPLKRFLTACVLLAFLRAPVLAQPPVNATLWAPPLLTRDLDPGAYAQWVDGNESPVTQQGWQNPGAALWTQEAPRVPGSLRFGDSGTPGIRYLRIGWKTPQLVGTVLVSAGGALSVLKPGAAYPGKLDDETQWIPAQRLAAGKITSAEVGPDQIALWVLPPATMTRALRFAHTPSPTDAVYGGTYGGAYALSARVANLAGQAVVTASTQDRAGLLTNDSLDGWGAWQNISLDVQPLQRTAPVSAEVPEWAMLTWPVPVKLRGVNLLAAAFTAADVQIFQGAAGVQPAKAAETDWKTVAASDKIEIQYPRQLTPNWIDFAGEYTTRAIRVRITEPLDEKRVHPHIVGKSRNGTRVYLGEIQALQLLGDAPLQPEAAPKQVAGSNPPIPVRFTLKTPGYVTLVIEGMSGKRIRNLVSETYFPAGANVAWWDGTDDLGRDLDAAKHGLYKIPAKFVQPGQYKVRGLVRSAINLSYEFGVYTAGSPPWPTVNHSGAWLSNHSPPMSALYVPGENSPSAKPAILLGSYVSEGRDGLAWVDLDGRKQGGRGWIGGTWTGAPYLARDSGPVAVAGVYAYAGAAWEDGLRLTALYNSGSDKPVLAETWKFPGTTPEQRKANAVMGGIAARDGILAVSLPKLNQVLLIDAKAGAVLATKDVPSPRGVAFDATGKLLVLSGKTLARYDRASDAAPATVIASGLDEPAGLALDAAGNIVITDKGSSHQAKIFDAAGKLIRAIGKAGAPKAGPYDPLHMNNPDGVTVDSNNHIWVAENDESPKRVSEWTMDGQLVKAFYGSSQYGGGGALDAADNARFYYGGMEFSLDWVKGQDKLVDVLYRPAPSDLALADRSGPPEFAIYRGAQRYFTNCFNSSPVGGTAVATLFIEKNGVARPVAAAGRAGDWALLKGDAFKPRWPAGADLRGDLWRDNGKNQLFFIWSDANDDGNVQSDEVSFQQGMCGGITVMPDLAFCAARVGDKAMRFAPDGFTAGGAPKYSLASGQVLATKVAGPGSSGGDQVLTGEDGLTVMTLGMAPFHQYSISGAKNGVPQWSYPNPWPGLHASHEAAKPDRPGQVIGATRLLGGFVKPKGSDVGQIWGVNANMGNMYLFTADGLFVATLFKDVRQGKLWQMPVATRGMNLNDLTLHDENFWPSISQSPDGQIYLVDGGNTCLVRVDGLESLLRLPDGVVRVGAEDLKSAQDYLVAAETARQAAEGSGVLTVAAPAAAPTVDGKLDEWLGAGWVDIDKSGVGANFNSNSHPYNVTAAVAVSGDRLYAAFRTGNPSLLMNSGEAPLALFKTGGALDIMLGTNPKADPKRGDGVEGDVRLLVTQVAGKTKALLYRAVVPGTKTPVPFSSPWRTITIDRVDDVTDQVTFAGADGNFELSIPLATLGLKSVAGQTLKGDIGILRGDGGQTVARTYWTNKATGIVADVPSEAMLTPNLWGDWKFE